MEKVEKPVARLYEATLVGSGTELRLRGKVYGHPQVANGEAVSTSRIVRVFDTGIIETESSLYIVRAGVVADVRKRLTGGRR